MSLVCLLTDSKKTGLPETIGVDEMNVIGPEQRETIHAHGLHRKCSSIKIYMKRYSVLFM
jgi:hypothetical protein